MSWADKVKATALAALAERTTTAAPRAADTPWSWNAHDVWLSRAKPLRETTPRSSPGEQATPTQQGTFRI